MIGSKYPYFKQKDQNIELDPINHGHYIELIDRVHVMASNIEDHLINHRLTADVAELKEYFEKAQESLMNAYQLIGNIMPDNDTVY
jgi:hypothetical protein